jgi:hypothetical protein
MNDLSRSAQLTPQATAADGSAPFCGNCRFFCDAAAELDAHFPQLRTLGSVYGSVRGVDGLCQRHQRYLTVWSSCKSHEPSSPSATALGI